jgi:hypothetical protein
MACNTFNFSKSTCTHVDVGYDFKKQLTYQDSDNVAIDLTNITLQMIIRDGVDEANLLVLNEVLTDTEDGIYITDAANGIFQLLIEDGTSVTIGAGIYLYELSKTESSGLKTILMEGTIEFVERFE